MAGHSRPKDGVLSLAYVPAISLRLAMPCAPKRDDKRGHDKKVTPPLQPLPHVPSTSRRDPG